MTDHIAIMKKSWNLTEKILTREKTIESRWYKNKYPPWNKIKPGETIYFKNSGEPVTIKTEVEKVLQFSDLNKNKVEEILEKYGAEDGIKKEKIQEFFSLFKDKKYCILIYLRNPEKIIPFGINKKGFGLMSAWLCVDNIERLKIN
ncbi:ASCH domain-containing protein [Candidatus Woesearchaeota archaeon]|nr:ASCH domain-containing protein [Candidatus Woesearchaeota archaeon]